MCHTRSSPPPPQAKLLAGPRSGHNKHTFPRLSQLNELLVSAKACAYGASMNLISDNCDPWGAAMLMQYACKARGTTECMSNRCNEAAADAKRDGGDFIKGCQHHHEQAPTCTNDDKREEIEKLRTHWVSNENHSISEVPCSSSWYMTVVTCLGLTVSSAVKGQKMSQRRASSELGAQTPCELSTWQ